MDNDTRARTRWGSSAAEISTVYWNSTCVYRACPFQRRMASDNTSLVDLSCSTSTRHLIRPNAAQESSRNSVDIGIAPSA